MAILFNTVIREVMRRVNGIAGAQITDAETAYLTNPLTTTAADNPRYNLSFVKDVVADVHGRIAEAIATTADPATGIGCHVWRSFFTSVTAPITSGSLLPKVDASSNQIIGCLGQAHDSAAPELYLTPSNMERISQYKQFNASNPLIYTVNPLLYHINGSIVHHTMTDGIVFECCTYLRDTIVTAINTSGGVATIPDVLQDALVAGTVGSLLIESEYADMCNYYLQAFTATLNAIGENSIAMPGLSFLNKGSQS